MKSTLSVRPAVVAAAAFVLLAPAAPALAHCKTVHHRVVHRVAYRAPVRCDCARPRLAHRAVRSTFVRETVYRPAAYPVLYRPVYRPRVVEVTYERPLYRRWHPHYYRPRPVFYGARYERFGPRRERFGWHRERMARWDGGFRRERYWR